MDDTLDEKIVVLRVTKVTKSKSKSHPNVKARISAWDNGSFKRPAPIIDTMKTEEPDPKPVPVSWHTLPLEIAEKIYRELLADKLIAVHGGWK